MRTTMCIGRSSCVLDHETLSQCCLHVSAIILPVSEEPATTLGSYCKQFADRDFSMHMHGQEEHKQGNVVGLDVSTGEALDPAMAGIFDNYLVKKQILQSAPIVASQLLLVDEVMRAGECRRHSSLGLKVPGERLHCRRLNGLRASITETPAP